MSISLNNQSKQELLPRRRKYGQGCVSNCRLLSFPRRRESRVKVYGLS